MIDPHVLIKNGVKLRKIVQREREFVVLKAKAYHSGFNSGYNIAEAVNFALESWIPIGKAAKYCKCENSSVRIDMDLFERRLRGEIIHLVKNEKEVRSLSKQLAGAKMMAMPSRKQ